MADDKYSCPMCHGEGEISWKVFHDENAPQRIFAYGAAALGILIGSAILYHATTPRTPTPLEQCSASCGATRFKQYTEVVPSWVEQIKGLDPGINHAPIPAKCECVIVEPK